MADGIYPSLVSATRDSNLVTNPIFVRIGDGTNNFPAGGGTEALALRVTIANDSTGVLSIDDNGSSITVDGTVTADTNFDYAVDDIAGGTDVGALVLAVRDDVLTTLTPADGDYTQLRVDSTGQLWTRTTVTNTALTPLYVQIVTTGLQSNEIHNYSTATPAGDAASNHDYTVTGTTFLLKSVIFSCSGAGKAEIQTGPVASLVTKAVVFLNARQGDTKQVFFEPPIEVPVTSTGTVRVIRTNRNSSATDVYSTIIGNDVA